MNTKSVFEHKYTVRVYARTTLATALLAPEYSNRIATSGLLVPDLVDLKSKGEEAKRQDAEQQSDLVTQRNAIVDTSKKWKEICEEQDALRRRMAAVVDDLLADPATRELAAWLAKIGYETYRVRSSMTPVAAAPAASGDASVASPPNSGAPTAAPTRERVVRTDRLSVAQQINAFARALLEPQRAPILAAFEARSFGRERLAKLAADSEAVCSSLGVVKLTSPEAGRLESEAVAAQKQRWDSCRRMIRDAVAGDPELERLWARC